MKRSTKAVLLSAFIFPGAGHLNCGFHIRGFALVITTIAAIGTLIVSATRSALAVLQTIQSQGRPLNLETMSQEASKAAGDLSSFTIAASILVIVACWIIAVVDAWFVGSRKDRESIERTASP